MRKGVEIVCNLVPRRAICAKGTTILTKKYSDKERSNEPVEPAAAAAAGGKSSAWVVFGGSGTVWATGRGLWVI